MQEEQIRKQITVTMIRLFKPFEIKGDVEVAAIVGAIAGKQFSESGVKRRILRGVYVEGEHFKQTGAKMRLWNREALIRSELERERE